MAFEEALVALSRPAGEDLSDWNTLKFTAVKLNTSGLAVKVTAITDNVYGILQNDPKAGEPARIAVAGTSKLKLAGTVAAGDSVSVNASGRGVVAAATSRMFGIAVQGGVAGDIIPVNINTAAAPIKA